MEMSYYRAIGFVLIWFVWLVVGLAIAAVFAVGWPAGLAVAVTVLPPLLVLAVSMTVTEIRDIRDGTY